MRSESLLLFAILTPLVYSTVWFLFQWQSNKLHYKYWLSAYYFKMRFGLGIGGGKDDPPWLVWVVPFSLKRKGSHETSAQNSIFPVDPISSLRTTCKFDSKLLRKSTSSNDVLLSWQVTLAILNFVTNEIKPPSCVLLQFRFYHLENLLFLQIIQAEM